MKPNDWWTLFGERVMDVTTERPTVAVLRPDDERLQNAVELLDALGVKPMPDPMLAVDPTTRCPRSDAAFVVFTSKTGVELLEDWTSGDATVCAIGETTAAALRDAGHGVDIVPREYTSTGLVDALQDRVDGRLVEVARSDHGSAALPDGLWEAGAYVHETVLYRLSRPESAGVSVHLAADGELDAVLFTSSLTVEYFMDIAEEQAIADAVIDGLSAAVVGVIGEPTRETACERGISADVISEVADFEVLARSVAERLD